MEVLAGSGRQNVRQRDVLQERRRCRTDQGRIDPIRQAVRLILLSTLRIENLDGLTVIVGRPGKIAVAFIRCRHGGEGIVRIAPARPVPSAEKEPFIAPVEDLRDVQRPTDVNSEMSLVVIGLR